MGSNIKKILFGLLTLCGLITNLLAQSDSTNIKLNEFYKLDTILFTDSQSIVYQKIKEVQISYDDGNYPILDFTIDNLGKYLFMFDGKSVYKINIKTQKVLNKKDIYYSKTKSIYLKTTMLNSNTSNIGLMVIDYSSFSLKYSSLKQLKPYPSKIIVIDSSLNVLKEYNFLVKHTINSKGIPHVTVIDDIPFYHNFEIEKDTIFLNGNNQIHAIYSNFLDRDYGKNVSKTSTQSVRNEN
jgi:hypothetical protein